MKILITGGTGTIGSAFIKNYPDHEYVTYSRNEENIAQLREATPRVSCVMGSVEDEDFLSYVICNHKPEVVIHAAAVKHINLAEVNPIHTCRVNVVGSLNVLNASIRNNVRAVVGISTDKVCNANSVYGDTKSLMEKCYLEANNSRTKVSIARFANVAGSAGSVVPFWKKKKDLGERLPITHTDMTRLMFTANEAVDLVSEVLMATLADGGGFIGMREMKSIKLLDLAEAMNPVGIDEVGLRPGEKLHECLFTTEESEFVGKCGSFLRLRLGVKQDQPVFSEAYSSFNATRMTRKEIVNLLQEC